MSRTPSLVLVSLLTLASASMNAQNPGAGPGPGNQPPPPPPPPTAGAKLEITDGSSATYRVTEQFVGVAFTNEAEGTTTLVTGTVTINADGTIAPGSKLTVDLRGLGAVRTLVLVNGHRLMPGDPRYPEADVNSIPTALIGRVEVLTGGSAAVYGSDAVAGVVNFILDTNLDGLKAEGQIGGYQHDNRDDFARRLLDQRQLPYPKGSVVDGRRVNVSASFGRGFLEGRGHVTLYGGYREITGVTQDQRDYGSCPITARIVNQRPTSVLECGGPNVSYPGNFFDNLDNVYQVTPERTFVPGLSRFNYAPWHFIQRPDKRYTAGGFANFDFSKALRAYAEVMAMKDRSSWQVGPSGDFRNTETINCENSLLSDQQRSLICRTGNFVGQTAVLDQNGNLVAVSLVTTILPFQFAVSILQGTTLH